MNSAGSEITLNLKEAWLVRSMVYSSGEEVWELRTYKPSGYEEEYDAAAKAHKPSQLKRIMYVEVTA